MSAKSAFKGKVIVWDDAQSIWKYEDTGIAIDAEMAPPAGATLGEPTDNASESPEAA